MIVCDISSVKYNSSQVKIYIPDTYPLMGCPGWSNCMKTVLTLLESREGFNIRKDAYARLTRMITNTAARKPINVQTDPTPDSSPVLVVAFAVAAAAIV